MAEAVEKQTSSKTLCEKEDDYDPELDFSSDKFNPLKALSTPGLRPPISGAITHDNLAKFESVVLKGNSGEKSKKKKCVSELKEANYERKWLPHQCKYEFGV